MGSWTRNSRSGLVFVACCPSCLWNVARIIISVNLNHSRSAGEDPTLTSSYAAHFVAGMQGNDSTYLKVASTLKHFAAYSQETGRINDPVVVTSQDMEDTYLPAFEAGVKKGKASGLMCSVCPHMLVKSLIVLLAETGSWLQYNDETFGYGIYSNGSNISGQYNGVPSCANKGLLTDLAREKVRTRYSTAAPLTVVFACAPGVRRVTAPVLFCISGISTGT